MKHRQVFVMTGRAGSAQLKEVGKVRDNEGDWLLVG